MKEAKPKAKNPSGDARELVDLVIAYAKQETLEPLKGLGKNALLGLGGAVSLGIGGMFCSIGALRAMQSELLARGIRVSCKAIWNFFRSERLTFKKKPARRRTGTAGRSKSATTVQTRTTDA